MKTYFALRELTYNGVIYKPGDKLKHKVGLRNQQMLNTMVRMRKITVTEPVDETLPPVDETLPPVDETLPPVDETLPPPSSVPEADHVGAGWYNIVMNGVVLNDSKLKGKEAAANWIKENC